jgi:hypothetical protein
MSAVHINWRTVEVLEVDEAKGVAKCRSARRAGYHDGQADVVLFLNQLWPDISDPVTAGHLLTLARQAYDDATITTKHYPKLEGPERKRWRVWRDGCPIAYGATEVEALVVAIEAAIDEDEMGDADDSTADP